MIGISCKTLNITIQEVLKEKLVNNSLSGIPNVFLVFFFVILIIHLPGKLQKYNFTEYFENQTDEQ